MLASNNIYLAVSVAFDDDFLPSIKGASQSKMCTKHLILQRNHIATTPSIPCRHSPHQTVFQRITQLNATPTVRTRTTYHASRCDALHTAHTFLSYPYKNYDQSDTHARCLRRTLSDYVYHVSTSPKLPMSQVL